MATGTEPLSAAGLAAALGVDATGAEGDAPVSVGNLRAVMDASPFVTLYDGPQTTRASLSRSAHDFDYLLVDITNSGTGYDFRGIAVFTGEAHGTYITDDEFAGGMYQMSGSPANYTSKAFDGGYMSVSGDGMTLRLDWNRLRITRVFGAMIK